MSEANTLMAACADHGVTLTAEHLASAEAAGIPIDGILALLQKYGAAIATVLPQFFAALTAKNYLGAMVILLTAIASAS